MRWREKRARVENAACLEVESHTCVEGFAPNCVSCEVAETPDFLWWQRQANKVGTVSQESSKGGGSSPERASNRDIAVFMLLNPPKNNE